MAAKVEVGEGSLPSDDAPQTEGVEHSWTEKLWYDLISSPVNLALLLAILFLLYKILQRDTVSVPVSQEPRLARMKRRDFTLEELRPFDGNGPEGRVLIGVLGKVYDVTKGKRFYGPGGPYSAFAGRDASRGLATFDAAVITETYDDLSDLKPAELDQVREWDLQFQEKYDLVGKLLKPGEEKSVYSDDEDESDEVKKEL